MSHTKKLVMARDQIAKEAERLRTQRDKLPIKNGEAVAELTGVIRGLDRAVKIIENVMVD